jgi:hypothetical protein
MVARAYTLYIIGWLRIWRRCIVKVNRFSLYVAKICFQVSHK